ncbi:hypothetical protein IDI10_004436, partial [Escherichia coli]|nr:hypothetical protein [Escherichia coli]
YKRLSGGIKIRLPAKNQSPEQKLTPPGIIPEVGLFHAFLLPQTNIKAILDLVRDLFFLIARDVLNENIHATLFNKT